MTDYPSRLKRYLANNSTASQHAPNIVNDKDEHSELIKKQQVLKSPRSIVTIVEVIKGKHLCVTSLVTVVVSLTR